MIRVGIVGFGTMGRIRYEAVVQNSGASVSAVADPRPIDNVQGVKVSTTAQEIIEEFNAQGLANTVWAFAKVEENGEAMVEARLLLSRQASMSC